MFNPLKVRLMRSVCGLDVHKDSVYLCILSEDGELIEKVFGFLTFQLHLMSHITFHNSRRTAYPRRNHS